MISAERSDAAAGRAKGANDKWMSKPKPGHSHE